MGWTASDIFNNFLKTTVHPVCAIWCNIMIAFKEQLYERLHYYPLSYYSFCLASPYDLIVGGFFAYFQVWPTLKRHFVQSGSLKA